MNGRTPSSLTPRGPLDRARPYLVTAMVPIVVLAVGSLVLEYGFHVAAQTRRVLQWIEVLALAGLMLEPLISLLLARDRREMLRARWFHYVLAAAFVLAVSALWIFRQPDAPLLTHRVVQVTILLNLVIRFLELNRFLAVLHVQPAMLVAGSFLTLIAAGTGLLLLPTATAPGEAETTFMDALFTAASAVCVTGLTVVDTGTHWAPLGRYVILVLIQLGGLGLMTFASVFALLLWRGMRVRELVVMREVLSHDLVTEVGRIIVFILLTTLCIEAAGAALLSGLWDHTATGGPMELADRIVYSIFHSVSAFCNAGFGLYSDNLVSYRATWQANVVIPLLIISGGIGFVVLYNFARLVRYRLVQRHGVPLIKKRVTLQTKMAVVTTVVLLAGGTLFIYVFETYPGGGPEIGVATCAAADPLTVSLSAAPPATAEPPMGRMWTERLSGAWFLAATSRTAGFNTTDTARLAPATKVLTAVLMFIGASPGGTGGGIKTVSLAVILAGIWSALRGHPRTEAFRRTIAQGTVLRALVVLVVGAFWVVMVSMVLTAWGFLPGTGYAYLDVLFETMSAFGTVGLSTGATPLLSSGGRLLIILTMFIGRVGPLTLFVAMQGRAERPRYGYPTENVVIS